MELAAELLATSNEQELDHFLSNLMRRPFGHRGRRMGPRRMRHLGGWMKGAVRRIFPRPGRYDWRYANQDQDDQDDPYSQYGQLGADSGELLGLEFEGLTAEDQEFNAARQLVRLAGTAAAKAADLPESTPPDAAAQSAMAQAAQIHAPGLVRGAPESSPHSCGCGGSSHACQCQADHPAQGGQWVRHGNRIVLTGI